MFYYYLLNPVTIFEFELKHAKGWPSLEYNFICFCFLSIYLCLFEFELKHAKGWPSLEYNFICFCFLSIYLCLFIAKVDNITKINKDWTIFFIFCLNFQNLKHYIFEITTVWCKKLCLVFMKSFFELRKVYWGPKIHKKLHFKLLLDITAEQNKN